MYGYDENLINKPVIDIEKTMKAMIIYVIKQKTGKRYMFTANTVSKENGKLYKKILVWKKKMLSILCMV